MTVGYDEKGAALEMLRLGREKLRRAEKAFDVALHDVGFWAADVEYWSKELAKHYPSEIWSQAEKDFMEGK